MQPYPPDSPEATIRVVALALLADGAIGLDELASLKQHRFVPSLGLDSSHFDQVIHQFCDDLLASEIRKSNGEYQLTPKCVGLLLAEIHEPGLRQKALSMMLDIVNADGLLSRGETALLAQVLSHWGLGLRPSQTPGLMTVSWQSQLRRDNAYPI
jgi:uncharacterized tellurite resistance protein B-like protein